MGKQPTPAQSTKHKPLKPQIAPLNAGITFHGYKGSKVAIISQEDAAVWVGEFDWTELEFVGKGKVRLMRQTRDLILVDTPGCTLAGM